MHAPKGLKVLEPLFSNCCLQLYLKHVYAKLSPQKKTDPHGCYDHQHNSHNTQDDAQKVVWKHGKFHIIIQVFFLCYMKTEESKLPVKAVSLVLFCSVISIIARKAPVGDLQLVMFR